MTAFLVQMTGIEPARRKALDPKSSASASFAIPANAKARLPADRPSSMHVALGHRDRL